MNWSVKFRTLVARPGSVSDAFGVMASNNSSVNNNTNCVVLGSITWIQESQRLK